MTRLRHCMRIAVLMLAAMLIPTGTATAGSFPIDIQTATSVVRTSQYIQTDMTGITPSLADMLVNTDPDEAVAVIARTTRQADLAALPMDADYDARVGYLQAVAEDAQRGILAWLETMDARDVRSFWLSSELALSATPGVIRELAARSDVAFVMEDFIVTLEATFSSASEAVEPDLLQEWNISKVRAPECWAQGYDGQGIVIGNIDSGVMVTHSAFGNRWRSTNGWYDAVSGRASPYDDFGHGTHCMGSAVGGNGIGVAPGATFIAAKGLDGAGSGQASWLAACFDWMAGTGRPDILSNSWGGDGTNSYFFNRVVNLRNLGIVVIGAIGNIDFRGTITPGNFPNVIGVGATDSRDAIASFSSRGPAPDRYPWNESSFWPRPDWNRTAPGIAAPGANIRSAMPNGGYAAMDGTSMAAPHVAGAAALLLQKNAALTHDQIFNLLTDNADEPSAGRPYPNNNYGWGRLNCKAALDNVGGTDNDVGVSAILAPAGTTVPGNITPQVLIRNFGGNSQTAVPVHITITRGGTEVYSGNATHSGTLSPGTTAQVNFSPQWNATDGSYTVTSWTRLASDENPRNDTARSTVTVTGRVTDTLRWYSGNADNAIGLTDGGTFYGAARFTPDMDYTLTKAFWFNFNRATSAEVVIYGPGSASAPGSQLEAVTSGVGEEQIITVETPPVNLPSGQDFWVAVKVTHTRGTFPLGVDAGPGVRGRGAFISMDGRAWDELWRIAPSLDFNWVIGAIAQSGAGIETELEPTGPAAYIRLDPNPVVGGMATLRYNLPKAGPAQVTVFDVTGRSVFSTRTPGDLTFGTVPLDLRSQSNGIYLVRLDAEGFSANRKLVVQR